MEKELVNKLDIILTKDFSTLFDFQHIGLILLLLALSIYIFMGSFFKTWFPKLFFGSITMLWASYLTLLFMLSVVSEQDLDYATMTKESIESYIDLSSGEITLEGYGNKEELEEWYKEFNAYMSRYEVQQVKYKIVSFSDDLTEIQFTTKNGKNHVMKVSNDEMLLSRDSSIYVEFIELESDLFEGMMAYDLFDLKIYK